MNNMLFICNTPFQCIISIIIRQKMFYDDEASIVISNQMNGAENLCVNLHKTGVFKNVYLIENAECFPRKKDLIYCFKRAKCDVFGCSKCKNIIDDSAHYKSVFLFNPACYAESIYAKLRRINQDIIVNLFDEGYSTYTNLYRDSLFKYNKIEKMLRYVNHIIQKRVYICDAAKDIYLMAPDLVCWNMPFKIHKVPQIDVVHDSGLIDVLNKAFSYSGQADEYNKKYVFFEESIFWDKGEMYDMKIIEGLANTSIGKHNMVIKLHPRNHLNRFNELGYYTNKQYGMPWEIIVMNLKEENDITFLTIMSGAVLSYKILFGTNFKTYLLYNCVPQEFVIMEYSVRQWFSKFTEKYSENFIIPSSSEELYSLLSEE